MGDPPGRMLQLLALLQSRRSWAGPDLAERLGITERTVRRDIDRLRLLGYPVEAAPGRYGGYQLGRGGHLPPLLLNDDEAVAVAIGLRSAVDGSVAGLEESALSTLSKLDHLLPSHVAQRVRALHDNTASMLWGQESERVDASALIVLAQACGQQHRARFDYEDRTGAQTSRLVEPLRLVRSGSRWYLVARDVDRGAWRMFRVDRMAALHPEGTRFELVDPPDAIAMVTEGLTARPYAFRARIRLPLPLEAATRVIPRTYGMLEAGDGATIIELGASSLERMVAYLAGLTPPCEVLGPDDLRVALRQQSAAVAAANQ
jgi:predicted DNA-binding transcriptional regulator YafY